MKTLGVCIPTYRRPEFLARCLASIIDQAGDLAVEVFVADDSCSDVNTSVIEAARSRFPTLRYHRNDSNLGINENIRRVVELADTDYVWLVGEDDFFLAGALAKVCAAIEAADGPFVMCNYALVGDEESTARRVALDVSVDAALTAEAFIRRHLWSAGFIGGCVIHLGTWRRVASDRYHGTYYAHVGHIVEMLARPDQPMPILATPLVANRAEAPEFFTWRSDALGVFFGFERMCQIAAAAVPALGPALVEAALVYREKQHYLTTRYLARMRADGIMDFPAYRRHLQPAALPHMTRLTALAMVLLPQMLFRAALGGKRWLRARLG